MLTIACVYKSKTLTTIGGLTGGDYGPEWVVKLRNAVARSFTVSHRFVCLSDVVIPGVKTVPLRNNWPGWWSKVELFRRGQFQGPVLYFDLDVVMRGNLDAMAGPFPGMVMLGDKLEGVLNSTALWWDASDPTYGAIYERFEANVHGEVAARQGIAALGDQSLIQGTLQEAGHAVHVWQEVLPADWFVPFSFFSRYNPEIMQGLPEAARLIYCLGNPKFNWNGAPDHVRELWR